MPPHLPEKVTVRRSYGEGGGKYLTNQPRTNSYSVLYFDPPNPSSIWPCGTLGLCSRNGQPGDPLCLLSVIDFLLLGAKWNGSAVGVCVCVCADVEARHTKPSRTPCPLSPIEMLASPPSPLKDASRHKADALANASQAVVLDKASGNWTVKERWEVAVGDFVKVGLGL